MVLGQIRENGGQAAGCAADPGVEDDFQRVIQCAIDTYASIDILAVVHGFNKPKNILEQSVADWQCIMDADLKSVYVVCKAAA